LSGECMKNSTSEEDKFFEGSPNEGQAWAVRYVRNRVSSCEAGWSV
jgi:hypothetical protein